MYIKNFCCRTNVPFSISHSLASGITSKINGSKLALQILTNNMTDFRKHTVFTHKKKDINFFFLERGEGKRKRRRETSLCMISCLSHTPNWGPGPQPRQMSWLGIEPATFQFKGQYSVHWAISSRASGDKFYQ